MQGRASETSKTITPVAGVDVGKETLDLAFHPSVGPVETFPNSAEGRRRLIKRVKARGAARFGLEASGPYGVLLAVEAGEAGLQVVALRGGRVRDYARFKGVRAKTDAIDAGLIAECAALVDAADRRPPTRREVELACGLTRIDQIDEDLARALARRDGALSADSRRQIEADVRRLARQKLVARKALVDRLRADPELARRYALVLSIPGIGEAAALALVIRLPELGELTRGQAAALVGVAPFDRQSGKSDNEKHIAGGRWRLRRALYMAAVAACTQHNPSLVAFYARLTKGRVAPKAAIIAGMRKLVVFANAIVARGTPWTAEEAATT